MRCVPMYVDTSALVKLYLTEPRSEACRKAADGRQLFTSALALAEFQSTLLRHEREGRLASHESELVWWRFREDVDEGRLYLSPLNDLVVHEATDVMWQLHPEVPLRTLDALHLATCKQGLAFDADGLLTTDSRMADAARRLEIQLVRID